MTNLTVTSNNSLSSKVAIQQKRRKYSSFRLHENMHPLKAGQVYALLGIVTHTHRTPVLGIMTYSVRNSDTKQPAEYPGTSKKASNGLSKNWLSVCQLVFKHP